MDGELGQHLEQLGKLQELEARLAPEAQTAWAVPLIALGVVGLLLWLTGRRLARPLLAMAGLLAGVAVASVWARQTGSAGVWTVAWLVGGGVAGGVVAWMMFRAGMAASMAVFLAIAGPAVVAALWNQRPLDVYALQLHWPDEGAVTQPLDTVAAVAGDLWTQVKAQLDVWWQHVPAGQVAAMVGLAVGGLIAGMVFGLILPHAAAGVLSAAVGAAMMLVGAEALSRANEAPVGAWLPQTPRAAVVMVGLITAVGVVVQWTIWRRRADK